VLLEVSHVSLTPRGLANNIVGRRVWEFTPHGTQVTVRTHESWSGEPVDADVEGLQQALDASLHAWLDNLKRRAEQSRRTSCAAGTESTHPEPGTYGQGETEQAKVRRDRQVEALANDLRPARDVQPACCFNDLRSRLVAAVRGPASWPGSTALPRLARRRGPRSPAPAAAGPAAAGPGRPERAV